MKWCVWSRVPPFWAEIIHYIEPTTPFTQRTKCIQGIYWWNYVLVWRSHERIINANVVMKLEINFIFTWYKEKKTSIFQHKQKKVSLVALERHLPPVFWTLPIFDNFFFFSQINYSTIKKLMIIYWKQISNRFFNI